MFINIYDVKMTCTNYLKRVTLNFDQIVNINIVLHKKYIYHFYL